MNYSHIVLSDMLLFWKVIKNNLVFLTNFSLFSEEYLLVTTPMSTKTQYVSRHYRIMRTLFIFPKEMLIISFLWGLPHFDAIIVLADPIPHLPEHLNNGYHTYFRGGHAVQVTPRFFPILFQEFFENEELVEKGVCCLISSRIKASKDMQAWNWCLFPFSSREMNSLKIKATFMGNVEKEKNQGYCRNTLFQSHLNSA